MNCIGLDIGTTSLSAVVMDTESGTVLDAVTVPNRGGIQASRPFECLQDAERIARDAAELLDTLCDRYAPICAIGLDGQMHGILYTDAQGRAVSPLYTWQDGRGNLPDPEVPCARALSDATGYAMASGYGLTTHYWNARHGEVPARACSIATIGDYVGMRLTGSRAPLLHISSAASMGLSAVDRAAWDSDALKAAGLSQDLLPEVTGEFSILGVTKRGVPVACNLGDNQASFIGSVRDQAHTALVNLGTGGQLSRASVSCKAPKGLEYRPIQTDSGILVGSSLCGGRAYALLERFIRSCSALNGEPLDKLYEAMNHAAAQAIDAAEPLYVSTLFCGTREEPSLRGRIEGISADNFDAAHLIAGVLQGMVDELHGFYAQTLAAGVPAALELVGSGNSLRRNPTLRTVLRRTFRMPLHIPAYPEEAAFGAALCGLTAAGVYPNLARAQQLIRYQSDEEAYE